MNKKKKKKKKKECAHKNMKVFVLIHPSEWKWNSNGLPF